jgi:Zn-dependent metalloprotease
MIPQYMAAKEISKDLSKGDKGTITPMIKIVDNRLKWGFIILSVIVGGTILYFVSKKYIKNYIDNKANKDRIKQIKGEINKKNLSWLDSEYASMADKIEKAVRGTFLDLTDEGAIYSVMMRMNNEDDLLMLQKAYGIRFKDEDMFDSLRNDLTKKEINKVNELLAQRNITIKI